MKKSKFPANFSYGIISVSKLLETKLKEALIHIIGYMGLKTNVDEVMVLPRGIDKGVSVKLALNYLGIDPKKTIVSIILCLRNLVCGSMNSESILIILASDEFRNSEFS